MELRHEDARAGLSRRHRTAALVDVLDQAPFSNRCTPSWRSHSAPYSPSVVGVEVERHARRRLPSSRSAISRVSSSLLDDKLSEGDSRSRPAFPAPRRAASRPRGRR